MKKRYQYLILRQTGANYRLPDRLMAHHLISGLLHELKYSKEPYLEIVIEDQNSFTCQYLRVYLLDTPFEVPAKKRTWTERVARYLKIIS